MTDTPTKPRTAAQFLPLKLGDIYMTPGVSDLIETGKVTWQILVTYIVRHQSGDWGDACEEDKASNDESLVNGTRIISAYPIDPNGERKGWGDNCIWIITEADRSSTTILLPKEY
jgi:hypothetical protein